jgi:hypothetical protein
MARASSRSAAWFTGRKRFQAATRAALPVFERSGPRLRINPLARWTTADLADYMRRMRCAPTRWSPTAICRSAAFPARSRSSRARIARAGAGPARPRPNAASICRAWARRSRRRLTKIAETLAARPFRPSARLETKPRISHMLALMTEAKNETAVPAPRLWTPEGFREDETGSMRTTPRRLPATAASSCRCKCSSTSIRWCANRPGNGWAYCCMPADPAGEDRRAARPPVAGGAGLPGLQ